MHTDSPSPSQRNSQDIIATPDMNYIPALRTLLFLNDKVDDYR